MSSNLIEGDALTPEQLEADAEMVEAGMGEVYAPLLEAKRAKSAKAAKHGNRKKVDRRFKTSDDGVLGSPSPNAKTTDPWDQSSIDYDEFFRLVRIIRMYQTPILGGFAMLPNANLDQMFDQIFQGRARTPANLLRLHHFMTLKHAGDFPALTHGPVYDVVVNILVKEGVIAQPEPEKPIMVFESFFPEAK